MDEVEKSNEEIAREILATRPDVDIALVERAVDVDARLYALVRQFYPKWASALPKKANEEDE